MKRIKFILVFLGLVVGLPALQGHGEEQDKVRDIMKQKLQHSQKILEGVALNDYDKIIKSGDELIDLSKQAEWRVLKTPQYELHSNDFRRSCDTLVKAAKDKNSDAVALAYVDLTLSCVKCHKYVREVRMTRLDK